MILNNDKQKKLGCEEKEKEKRMWQETLKAVATTAISDGCLQLLRPITVTIAILRASRDTTNTTANEPVNALWIVNFEWRCIHVAHP